MTTPYTEMLAVYRACPRGLTEGEAYGGRLLAAPDGLASLFLLSVAQFSRYVNVDAWFHGAQFAPAFSAEHGKTVEQTVDVAQRLATAARRTVDGDGGFDFVYVDRELDVMRTSTMQPLDDGTNSKRALVLDLLLAHSDGTPILAEVKIRADTHPIYALVQVLAAAAHLVTPAQRKRLENCYPGSVVLPEAGSYVDLAVILVDNPVAGKAPGILRTAQHLARALLGTAAVGSLVRDIHFLVCENWDEPWLVFHQVPDGG